MKKKMTLVLVVFLAAFPAGAMFPEGSLLDGVKPGDDGEIDVLTIFAHQDDEAGAGGTLIKLKQDPRVRVHIACLTLGNLSGAKDVLKISGEELTRIRKAELRTAAAVYDADEVIQLEYPDQGLKPANQAELVQKIRDLIARTGAEVVITHDPAGISRHPDHVTCSRAVTAAFNQSQAKRLYYVTLPPSLYQIALFFATFQEPGQPAVPTLKVNIRGGMRLKRLAIFAHASQTSFSTSGIGMTAREMIPYEWFALAGSRE